MDIISKTITRKPRDRRRRLIFSVDQWPVFALIGLGIIAGLETWYRNRTGDPNTLYVAGFWTLVYGLSLLFAYLQRRKGPKKYVEWLRRGGMEARETVRFSEEGFEAAIDDYFAISCPWTSLTSFKVGRRWIRLTLAGIEFLLPAKRFTDDERAAIRALLERKKESPDAPADPAPEQVPPAALSEEHDARRPDA